MQEYSFNSAILFLVFNRLQTTKKVFSAIREMKPSRLYIASDGHRINCPGEADQVNEVRDYILANVDWNCEFETLFREHNLGCRRAVEGAITWFLDHEPMGIILEDDCLPDLSFFRFCEELLERYQSDTRIMAVSGDNFQPNNSKQQYSYYFSRYPHCWGWATWARAWDLYDSSMKAWPAIRDTGKLENVFCSTSEARYWSNKFQQTYDNKIDTWDYRWTLSCWLQNGLTVLPATNLVSNIGFNTEATHTSKEMASVSCKIHPLNFPLSHPPYIIRDAIADQITYDRIYRFRARLIRKAKGFLDFHRQ